MNTSQYTWNHLLFTADMLVQKGELTEQQLKKIMEIVDVEKVVKHNKLSPEFIDKYVKPKIEENEEEYDSMTMYDVYQIQNYKKNSNN